MSQNRLTNVPSIAGNQQLGSKSIWITLTITILLGFVAAVGIPIIIIIYKNNSTTTTTTAMTTVMTTISSTTVSTPTTSLCAATYSQSFVNGAASSAQCTAWTSFLSGLTCSTYSSLRFYGSNDPGGINITNPVYATAVIAALRTGSSYTTTSNGYAWVTGTCGSSMELNAGASICACSTAYTIRPCIGNSNWGGINSATCGAASQTISVSVQ